MNHPNNPTLTLEQLLAIEEEQRALTQPFDGKWLQLNPTEAVIEAIKLEKELKTYFSQHKTLTAVGGNIGLGKTTFARILAYGLDIEGSFELDAEKDHINDELLAKFLEDKPTYCFPLQQHLLQKRLRFREHNARKDKSCIEDRTPEEDPIVFYQFMHQMKCLTDGQLEQLRGEAIEAYQNSPKSDLMIVLQGKPELSRLRILQRRRPQELNAWRLKEELHPLAELYKTFPQEVPKYGLHQGPILVFDLDKIDITNRVHEGYIYERILKSLS